ncbi:MAG: two-component system response regulator [Candidatus Fischerbacteria bacterium RBG_13_37_8]|uniref:Two-component system response regulator n=1 Tax=Candidatus Fischerbacteria bacterium RBG_13_37_8 TaxID=1817863 RepID=A0A1F5VEV8_9BACT|nr:MAG: two-component system response regulator [Candidatus Fischerbacteria bacterium RBG_13_37_8]
MNLKILVVEDSSIMRGYVASSLKMHFPEIESVEVDSGFEALKALPRNRFDVIITDINMPDINGLELISFIKKHPQYKDIPVIIISTEKSNEDRQKGLALGVFAYISKPFTPEELSSTIKKAIENKPSPKQKN